MYQIEQHYGTEISNLFDMFFNMYYSTLFSDKPNLIGKRREILYLLDRSKSTSPEKAEVYDKVEKIMDSIYQLLQKKEVVKQIKEGKIGKELFVKIYDEEILGDNKRSYYMRDLEDKKLLANSRNNSYDKMINYKDFKQRNEREYQDKDGKLVRILPLGELDFTKDNFLSDYVYKYRVQREIEQGRFVENIVYTDISIIDMDNEEYRAAVLDELLSQNNIALSDCEGYIGAIERSPQRAQNDELGKESQDADGYEFRVSKNYVLRYRRDALSAVVAYSLGKGRKVEIGGDDNGLDR